MLPAPHHTGLSEAGAAGLPGSSVLPALPMFVLPFLELPYHFLSAISDCINVVRLIPRCWNDDDDDYY